MLVAILVLAAPAASAQTVVLELRNGDRLSGAILSETTNWLVLSNAWTAQIVLPQDQIARRFLVPQPSVDALATTNGGALSNALSAGAGSLAVSTNASRIPAWTGEALVGLAVSQNTRSRQGYSGMVRLTYTNGPFNNIIAASGSYGKTDGVVDTDRMDGSDRTDYDLKGGWYLYNAGGVGYDSVRKIDFRYEVGPGLGYHLVHGPNAVFNIELGGQYWHEDRQGGMVFDQMYGRVGESGSWKINQKFSLDHRLEYLSGFDGFDRFRVRGEVTLRYIVWKNLMFNMGVLEAYDTDPAQGVPPNDFQIRSSLGYKF